MKQLFSLLRPLKHASKLFAQKDTPTIYKLIPIGAILYIIFPLDFISDLIPAIGQLDDLAIFSGSISLFNSLAKNKN